MKYIIGAIYQASGKTAPHIRAITGIFALHGMKDAVIMVIMRSFSFSIVLVAITPGTVQPDDTKSGMKLFPENPNLCKILSMIKAILVIYPQSSSSDKNVNKTNICGTNDKTEPTPEIIPSVIKLHNQ